MIEAPFSLGFDFFRIKNVFSIPFFSFFKNDVAYRDCRIIVLTSHEAIIYVFLCLIRCYRFIYKLSVNKLIYAICPVVMWYVCMISVMRNASPTTQPYRPNYQQNNSQNALRQRALYHEIRVVILVPCERINTSSWSCIRVDSTSKLVRVVM